VLQEYYKSVTRVLQQAEFKAKQKAIKEAAKEEARLLKLQAKSKYQKA
jgi:hypothetical protein